MREFWRALAVLAMYSMMCPSPSHAIDNNVMAVPGDDAEMNAAIARARSTLPDFWRHYQNPQAQDGGFSVKVKITDGDKDEHFWCNDLVGDANLSTCIIQDPPQSVNTVKEGERVKVDPAAISDWIYTEGELIHGGRTMRLLLGRLASEKMDSKVVDEKLSQMFLDK